MTCHALINHLLLCRIARNLTTNCIPAARNACRRAIISPVPRNLEPWPALWMTLVSFLNPSICALIHLAANLISYNQKFFSVFL